MEKFNHEVTDIKKIDIGYLDSIPNNQMAQEIEKIETQIKDRFNALKTKAEEIEINVDIADEGVSDMETDSKNLRKVIAEMESLTRTTQELIAYSNARLNPH